MNDWQVGRIEQLTGAPTSAAEALAGIAGAQLKDLRAHADPTGYPECCVCKAATNALAADPGCWPHRIGYPEGNGKSRAFCGKCLALITDQYVRNAREG